MDLAAIKEKPYYFSNRALKRLIVPMIIEQFLAILVGMSDSIMVATVGEHAVSGVSLVDNIFILLIYLFAALATGGAVVMGQYLGQNKHEKANRAVNQLILFTALFAICIMIGLYLARNLILHRHPKHIFLSFPPPSLLSPCITQVRQYFVLWVIPRCRCISP